ncbi:thiamine pyrophosphate-dependent enzyme, partial [Thermodesulfobacteriota bacterium]
RPCLRVCHARQNVRISTPRPVVEVGPFKKNWQRWAAIPKFRLLLHGELNEKLEKMRQEEPEANPRPIMKDADNSLAVITSGSVASHVRDVIVGDSRLKGVNVFKVDMPFPASTSSLQEIVENHEKTLIIEETYPVLELQLSDRRKVIGRLSGHVPQQGELVPELVEDIILSAAGETPTEREAPSIKPRRPSLCPGCPHRPAFFLVKQVFQDAVYTGDIGCYTLGINMGVVDTCLCMGASVGMAAGFSMVGDAGHSGGVVATIGDSTFYHSGVPALINAVHTGARFVLVIMDNGTTAMTGGQPTPATDYLADGTKGTVVDMEKLVRGCGADFLEVVDPYDFDGLKETLEKAKAYTYDENKGVSVVIARRPCVRMPGVETSDARFSVNENCDRCMSCIRDLECPAFEYVKKDKQMLINEDLCSGCGVCVQTCPAQAVEPKGA